MIVPPTSPANGGRFAQPRRAFPDLPIGLGHEPGSRPRVLVIPGLNGHPGMLMEAAPELFPGKRALPFDHHQDLAEDGVPGLAERALAVLDADEDESEPAYVCGESFGGPIALELARRHPRRVRGLLLFSTFASYPPLAALGGQASLALWRSLGPAGGRQAFRAGRPFSIPGQLGFRFSRDVVRTYLARPEVYFPAYHRKCELSLTFDARGWLAAIDCPVFVLTGGWDPVVPTSCGAALASLVPCASLHRLPGGHLVHLVRPREVGALVERWMAEAHESPRGR